VAELIAELASRIGMPAFVAVCTDLMGGADREEHVEELRSLTGHDWQPGDAVLDRTVWHDYWVRTWGARGLLHVWDDSATSAVVAGLADEHWRPAEMCLKVTARHDVAGAGDAASVLLDHDLPRVRAQALRALAVAGDTQHVELVRERLEDDDEQVRAQAERALKRLGTRLDVESDLWLPERRTGR
jgi:hypothetical protein